MYVLEITIPGLPPTTNSNGRLHWAIKAKQARHWKGLVRLFVRGHIPQEPLLKAKVTLIRCSSSEPDADGTISSFKHILDGLVDIGVLEDDKISNIGIPDYRWEKSAPKNGHIKIKVEEV